MTIEILITAQNWENYSFDGGFVDTENPSWKMKGSSHFKVSADDFWLMYAENEDIQSKFQEVLDEESNGVMKYQYISHEILWHGIDEIEGIIN